MLKPEIYFDKILSYKGSRNDISAHLRLGWPYEMGHKILEISKSKLFWAGIPEHIFAHIWLRGAIRTGTAIDLHAPAKVHQYLIEEFAVVGLSNSFPSSSFPFIKTNSKLAVWWMFRNQQILQYLMSFEEDKNNINESLASEFEAVCRYNDELDYTGIESNVKHVVKDIISLTNQIIYSYCSPEKERLTDTTIAYANKLREYLQEPGLASLLSCQCTILFLASLEFCKHFRFSKGNLDLFMRHKSLKAMENDITPFIIDHKYRNQTPSKKYSRIKKLLRSMNFRYIGKKTYFQLPAIKSIRLDRSDPCVNIVDLLKDITKNRRDIPFEWINTMPLPTELVRELVENNHESLKEVLKLIGGYRIFKQIVRPLRVQYTQRILKVARNSDCPITLSGVAAALSNSNFMKIAETELILKILKCDIQYQISPEVFMIPSGNIKGDDTESIKEVKLIEKVANKVICNAAEYPFKTVCGATAFMFQHRTIELPPMLELNKSFFEGRSA